jgi:phytoene synthase
LSGVSLEASTLDAYRHCARIVRASNSSFAAAFWMLSREQRRALHAIYAFCRLADDIADDPSIRGDRRELLQRWRAELDDAYAGRPGHPVGVAMSDTVARFDLPKAWFLDLLEGIETDLLAAEIVSFAQLERYCYCVASTVGLSVVAVLGVRNPATERYAVDMGIAVQLTNILRDVGDDAASGRIYLAREDLDRHGVSREAIGSGELTPAVRALLREHAKRAHVRFDRARAEIPAEHARTLRPAQAMGEIYFELLQRLERSDFPCLDRVLRLSKVERVGIAARVWLRPGIAA